MGKYILLLIILITSLTSCSNTLVEGKTVISKIELDNSNSGYKYFVYIDAGEGGSIYYRTNLEYKVGDTLVLIPIN